MALFGIAGYLIFDGLFGLFTKSHRDDYYPSSGKYVDKSVHHHHHYHDNRSVTYSDGHKITSNGDESTIDI